MGVYSILLYRRYHIEELNNKLLRAFALRMTDQMFCVYVHSA